MADESTLVSLYSHDTNNYPTNLNAILQGTNSVLLSWTAPNIDFVSGYKVLKSYTDDLIFNEVGETINTSFAISGLEAKRDYNFVVKSILYDQFQIANPAILGQIVLGMNFLGNGVLVSGIVVSSYDPSYAPLNVKTTGSNDGINIYWDTPIVTGVPVSGYRIWRTDAWNKNMQSIGSTLTNFYFDSGLNINKNYYYRVSSLY